MRAPSGSSDPPIGPSTPFCKTLNASQRLPAAPGLPARAPPPAPRWVTDCDKALLPVSGNSFPVSPRFHLSGARGPPHALRAVPSVCQAAGCLHYFHANTVANLGGLRLSARGGCHITPTLMSLGPRAPSPANEAAERKLRGKITQARCSRCRQRNKMSKKNRGTPFTLVSPPPLPRVRAALWRQEMESWVLTTAPPGFAPCVMGAG